MTQVLNPAGTGLTVLDNLAQEARYYSQNAASSMVQLGRVLLEAKPLVRHGEWETWLQENAGCSTRYAQVFMQIYRRFGTNSGIAQIGERGKLFKMLSLPEGTEDRFLQENNVQEMTTREVEEAVRAVRAEMGLQIEQERRARQKAEQEARSLMEQPTAVPDEVQEQIRAQEQELSACRAEISRLADMGRDAIEEAGRLRSQMGRLEREVEERDEMLAEAQQEYDRMQSDLLNLQSAQAKGDAERVPSDTLTFDVFASAVREFMGVCARLPQMRKRFAAMSAEERNEYDELVLVIENWAVEARNALNTYAAEGATIRG